MRVIVNKLIQLSKVFEVVISMKEFDNNIEAEEMDSEDCTIELSKTKRPKKDNLSSKDKRIFSMDN